MGVAVGVNVGVGDGVEVDVGEGVRVADGSGVIEFAGRVVKVGVGVGRKAETGRPAQATTTNRINIIAK